MIREVEIRIQVVAAESRSLPPYFSQSISTRAVGLEFVSSNDMVLIQSIEEYFVVYLFVAAALQEIFTI